MKPGSIQKRPWAMACLVVLGCWAITFIGPLSLLIVPALIVATVWMVRRRAWFALTLLLASNPLGGFFAGGVLDYARGTPTLHFVGLPGIESYNLDRSSRGFPRGGGCLVSGNELVFSLPHNSAVRMMAKVFGPPSNSYDGPYPTKEEAMALTEDAATTPVREFLEGKVKVDGENQELGSDLIDKLIGGLDFGYVVYSEEGMVRASLYDERCLILRLSDKHGYGYPDTMIFFDREAKRPFAYFNLSEGSMRRHPPMSYLPEHDRSQ